MGNQSEKSDSKVIDMDEIEEMISGSGLDFGKKVKSDYMHSRISANSIGVQPGPDILDSINAKSSVYRDKQGGCYGVYWGCSITLTR